MSSKLATPPTVEDYLNEIDYSSDKTYLPSDFALEFINFIKLVNGNEGEEHLSPVVHYKMLDQVEGRKQNIVNMCSRGLAKALDVNTLLITPTGHLPMGDVQVGDRVIDRNGQPTEVTAVSDEFTNQAYKVELTDGSSFIANEDHIHIVQRRTQKTDDNKPRKTNGRKATTNIWVEETLTTLQLLAAGVTTKRKPTERNKDKELKYFVPLVSSATNFDSTYPSLDPYTVGVILGDGNVDKVTGTPTITCHEDDLGELCDHIPYSLGKVYSDKRRPTTKSFRVRDIATMVKKTVGTATSYTKSIPQDYLFGDVSTRTAVLRGLMDTDGTITTSGHASFCSTSKALAKGVVHLVKSLGGYARITEHTNTHAGYFLVHLNLLDINPFSLHRKAVRWIPNKHYKSGVRVGIASIEPVDNIVSKCIKVASPTESYLIEDCVVTHNTTLLGEYLFLYVAVYGSIPGFGEISLALYVSDSIDNGVKNMRKNLEFRWDNSEFLQEYIPKVKFTETRWEFTNIDGKPFIVKSYGAKTGVRGTKELGVRPNLAVLDDLVSDEDARSATVIASIEDTVYKAIDYALHPTTSKIIWSGTPFNARDPLYKAVESGAWAVNVFPVCEEFPCSKEDFRGAWEDRFTYEYVLGKYTKAKLAGKLDTFNQELMLRIMSEEDRLINDGDINWYRRANVLTNKGRFNFYITTDFATSDKESADFSVISVWALNNNGDWFWVDGVVKKQTMDKNVEDLFRLAQQYKPQEVGIEVSGQQGGFIPWIQNEMMTRNIYFPLASENNSTKPGIRPNTDKMVRFQIVVPWFKTNKIFFPEEMRESPEIQEFLNELSLVSLKGFRAKNDDCIDTISMLASLRTWKPSQEGAVKQPKGSDIWEMEEYEHTNNLSSYIV